ncbi:MAG TPA: hypothetical protein VMS76_08355 [Planctomycetota bacterium]|nr:hypothetical protein [Planctomycetota bacterium]
MPSSDRRNALFALLVALPAWTLLAWRFDFLIDDAFISFRYARHLAEGIGLRFNPGESPPVEGFTNLLWVLYLALLERLGLDPAVGSRAASLACAVALLAWLSAFLARGEERPPLVTVLAVLFLATLPPFAVWSTGGLETMPFALAVFAFWERLAGDPAKPRPLQAGAWALAAILLRADGFAWVTIVLVAVLAVAPRPRPSAIGTAAAIATAGLALLCAWRWSYFGSLEPNTARAKVDLGLTALERGVAYAASLPLAFPSVALVLAAGLWIALRAPAPRIARQALLILLGGAAYMALVGGDWMAMFRLLVPALPFLAILFAEVAAALHRRHGGRALAAGLAAACLALSLPAAFDLHVVPRPVRELAHFRWTESEMISEHEMWQRDKERCAEWALTGRALALHTRPGESIVLGAIGAIGYHTDLVIHDVHGLTNREPLPEETPERRQSAGHDRVLPIAAFDKYRPTYRFARLAPAEDPERGLPQTLRGAGSSKSGLERLEFALHPHDGFPPGKVLQLFRNVWQ